jgi:hypothetical protein
MELVSLKVQSNAKVRDRQDGDVAGTQTKRIIAMIVTTLLA